MPLTEKTVRIRSPSLIFSNNATIPGDIWTASKELMELFESIDYVACRFPGFFSTLAVKDKIIVLETGFAE